MVIYDAKHHKDNQLQNWTPLYDTLIENTNLT